jgi:hypothetical protein
VFPPVSIPKNWHPSDGTVTMENLVGAWRKTHSVPATKIDVVTALLGSACPMRTLTTWMPDVHHVGSAVYVEQHALPGLLNNRHSYEHVFLSLPELSTAPFCLRHADFCDHLILDNPHVLMCDHGALKAKLPNIVTRLFWEVFGVCSR